MNMFDQSDLSKYISFPLTNFKLVISHFTEIGLNKLKILVRWESSHVIRLVHGLKIKRVLLFEYPRGWAVLMFLAQP